MTFEGSSGRVVALPRWPRQFFSIESPNRFPVKGLALDIAANTVTAWAACP